jgi:hypothetical protein
MLLENRSRRPCTLHANLSDESSNADIVDGGNEGIRMHSFCALRFPSRRAHGGRNSSRSSTKNGIFELVYRSLISGDFIGMVQHFGSHLHTTPNCEEKRRFFEWIFRDLFHAKCRRHGILKLGK